LEVTLPGRISGAGRTQAAHCSSLGRVAPTGSVPKRLGAPVVVDVAGRVVVAGTVVVAASVELEGVVDGDAAEPLVTVASVPPPLEHEATTPITTTTTSPRHPPDIVGMVRQP
jgi:hypothetical protein